MEVESGSWPIFDHLAKYTQRSVYTRLLLYGLCRWWWHHGIDDERTHMAQIFRPSLEMPSLRGIGRPADMVFWVILIGMRLRPDTTDDKSTRSEKLSTSWRILLLLLDLPHVILRIPIGRTSTEEAVFWANKLTIGQVLDRCYKQQFLEKPDPADRKQVYRHALELGDALALLSIWAPQRNRHGRLGADTVEDLRSMKISAFWQKQMRPFEMLKDSGQPKTSDTAFNSREMSIEVLRKVGKIIIIWTEYLDEHMTFDQSNRTLKIFWFGFDILANPIFQ